MIKYDEWPSDSNKKQFSEMPLTDLEKLLKSKKLLAYFQSDIIYLYKYIGEIKMDMNILGMKFEVKLSQKKTVEIDNPPLILNSVSCIKKHFQEIYEDILLMQNDLDTLFENDS